MDALAAEAEAAPPARVRELERVAEEDALLERRPIAEKRTRAEMELSQKVLLKWFKERI